MTVRAKDKKTLDKFLKAIKGKKGPLTFSSILPCPEELREIHTGGCKIGKKYVTAWREVKGKEVAVTPKEIKSLIKKYGAKDWYDWACMNWGTKWDLTDDKDEVAFGRDGDTATFSFDTAWSPPVAWCEFAAGMFPGIEIEIHFREDGCGVHGTEVFGEV